MISFVNEDCFGSCHYAEQLSNIGFTAGSAYEYAVWTKQEKLMLYDYTNNVLYDVLIYFIIRTSLALTPLMICVPN